MFGRCGTGAVRPAAICDREYAAALPAVRRNFWRLIISMAQPHSTLSYTSGCTRRLSSPLPVQLFVLGPSHPRPLRHRLPIAGVEVEGELFHNVVADGKRPVPPDTVLPVRCAPVR